MHDAGWAQAVTGLGFFIAMDGMYAACAGSAGAAIAMDGMYAAGAGSENPVKQYLHINLFNLQSADG